MPLNQTLLLTPGIQGKIYITGHGTAMMAPQRKQYIISLSQNPGKLASTTAACIEVLNWATLIIGC